MVTLDIENINSSSPYRVTKNDATGFYVFATRFGVQYGIRFDSDDLLGIDGVYQFIIANLNNKKSPSDSDLRATIVAIVMEFFETSSNTMLYICETGDGKQDMRGRLFHSWFKAFTSEERFAYYDAHIIEEEGVSNHASIILRRDNPNFDAVVKAFKDSVLLLSNKPS